MALENGVLVHGPRFWACAVRGDDGRLFVASDGKSLRSVDVKSPLLRGPARVVEALAVLPAVKRALPAARLPFLEPRAIAAMAGTTLIVRSLRSSGLSPALQELATAFLALVPATATLKGSDLAAYHGAEHISIGTYEHGELRPREHERCGSHLLGPLLVTTVAGNILAGRLGTTGKGRALARVGVGIGSLAVATEVFSWTLRHPASPVSRAIAWPGRELQTRVLTAEPTPGQLEVAKAALAKCLELELRESAARAGSPEADR
jgi:uncharacterized protein YqhQ